MRSPQRPPPASATAQSFAVTASVASIATVMAVPSAMARTDRTPPSQRPLRKAKDRTINAPEQGRIPTAVTAAQAALRSRRSPEIVDGSTAWLCAQLAHAVPAARASLQSGGEPAAQGRSRARGAAGARCRAGGRVTESGAARGAAALWRCAVKSIRAGSWQAVDRRTAEGGEKGGACLLPQQPGAEARNEDVAGNLQEPGRICHGY